MRLKIILLSLLVLLLSSCNDEDFDEFVVSKYQTGDNSSWSAKNLDDSRWNKIRESAGDQIYWTRQHIQIKEDPKLFNPKGILINSFGSYEAYWDGVLIGINGTPGYESKMPKSGNLDRTYMLPDSLTKKGDHVLALRMSQYYYNDEDRVIAMAFGNYEDLIKQPLLSILPVHILAGTFLFTAIYFLVLFFNDTKSLSILLFSISSIFFFLLVIVEYVKYYIPIHYSDFYVRLEIISILIFLISLLIPFYFSIQFYLPYKKHFIFFYFLLLAIIYLSNRGHGNYDETVEYLSISMWTCCVLIVGYGVYKKKQGAHIVLAGLLTDILINYFLKNYDNVLALSFFVLLLSMFYILALWIKEQRKAQDYYLIRTERLKYELLKKKIQPHFLMNTLTSLIDWIEESPTQGIIFIEALAREFDLLNQIEDKQLISISQEINLCKNHLHIMKYRKEIHYSWEDEGIDETQTIPPAIIHTLIENGITHCVPLENSIIKFKLIYDVTPKVHSYTLLTKAFTRTPARVIVEGTGTKYIKARLSESYGNNWKFESESMDQGWKNVISIYRK